MSTTMSSGNQTVNGTVTTTVSSIGFNLSIATANRSTAGTTAILTVPANHEYDVYCFVLATNSQTSGNASGRIEADGNTFVSYSQDEVTAAGYTETSSVNLNLAPNFLTYAAGKVINLITVGTIDTDGYALYRDRTV